MSLFRPLLRPPSSVTRCGPYGGSVNLRSAGERNRTSFLTLLISFKSSPACSSPSPRISYSRSLFLQSPPPVENQPPQHTPSPSLSTGFLHIRPEDLSPHANSSPQRSVSFIATSRHTYQITRTWCATQSDFLPSQSLPLVGWGSPPVFEAKTLTYMQQQYVLRSS
ncbi:hypothetical protein B0H14DRAFT_2820209 [Mycena olivaceomarginata]|nr:hypothetical protein B0H14DRAFT_2820209 [Mycena olivaceomarginata]